MCLKGFQVRCYKRVRFVGLYRRLVLFLRKGFDKAGKSLALVHTGMEIPGHLYKCKELRLLRF